MKKVILVLLLFQIACSTRSHFSMYSTKEIDKENFSVDTTKTGDFVSGKVGNMLLLGIPTGRALLQSAIDEAYSKTSSPILLDTTITNSNMIIVPVFYQGSWTVEGCGERK